MELTVEQFVIEMLYRIVMYIYYYFNRPAQPAIARTYDVYDPIDATIKVSYFPQESHSMKTENFSSSPMIFDNCRFAHGTTTYYDMRFTIAEPQVRQRVDVEIRHELFNARDFLSEAEQEVEEYLRYER